MALIALLDEQNETFSNAESVAQADTLVVVASDHNTVTNSGVLWTLNNDDAIVLQTDSVNATITNTATGYVRGGLTAAFVGGSATVNNAGEMIGGARGIDVDSNGVVKINNAFGGTIKSDDVGISFIAGDGSEIANDGIIFGDYGVMLGAKLTNSGEVGGASSGVTTFDDATIVNKSFGTIWSSGTGINVTGGQAVITNDADSLIAGSQTAITTTNGIAPDARLSLTNHGKIEGGIDCNATVGEVTDLIIKPT